MFLHIISLSLLRSLLLGVPQCVCWFTVTEVPQVPGSLQSFFFLFLNLNNFHCTIFKSVHSFFSALPLNPSSEFCISVIPLVLEFKFSVPLLIFPFCSDIIFLIFLPIPFLSSLRILKIVLKSLFARYTIWSFSETVSVGLFFSFDNLTSLSLKRNYMIRKRCENKENFNCFNTGWNVCAPVEIHKVTTII